MTAGEQALQTGGESLDDSTAMDDEDISPQPQGRRNRREACTCPFCKDGEGRYVIEPLFLGTPVQSNASLLLSSRLL